MQFWCMEVKRRHQWIKMWFKIIKNGRICLTDTYRIQDMVGNQGRLVGRQWVTELLTTTINDTVMMKLQITLH